MTFLGLNSGKAPEGEVSVGFRRGWFRNAKVVLGSTASAAAFLAVADLLNKRPSEGFNLLQQWGPWPFIVLVALGVVGSFMSRINDTIQTSFAGIVSSSERGAEASVKTADALTRLADQGGKQAEEVRRLAIYAAQEFPSVYERFDRQDKLLSEMGEALRQLIERDKQDGVLASLASSVADLAKGKSTQ